MRWLTRPLLELGYLVSGLFAGVVTFTVTVTGLALSVGLIPAFLLGVPVFGAVVYVVHGLAVMERHRAALFLDVELPARPVRNAPGLSWLRRVLLRARSPEFWKEAGYGVLLLPVGVVSASLALSFWAAAVTGLLLPLYAERLPGDEAITWLDWSDRLEVAAGFGAGLVMLLLARVLTAGLALAQRSLASALLSPSSSDALRAQVSQLTETRARVVDAADAERRRIERDLHDGAQQHLVALAMNLGRAKEKLRQRPRGRPRAGRPRPTRRPRTRSPSCATSSAASTRPVLTDRGLDAALSGARRPLPGTGAPRRRRPRAADRHGRGRSPTSWSPRR